MMTATETRMPMAERSAPHQVVVVSKQSRLNPLLEAVLDAGHYDVVFVESTEHAYSHIKRLSPQLIIVCLDIDDIDGFHVLSMLKLDKETRTIPVVTCTIDRQDETAADEALDQLEDALGEPPAMWMN